jgi:hypothetical protein
VLPPRASPPRTSKSSGWPALGFGGGGLTILLLALRLGARGFTAYERQQDEARQQPMAAPQIQRPANGAGFPPSLPGGPPGRSGAFSGSRIAIPPMPGRLTMPGVPTRPSQLQARMAADQRRMQERMQEQMQAVQDRMNRQMEDLRARSRAPAPGPAGSGAKGGRSMGPSFGPSFGPPGPHPGFPGRSFGGPIGSGGTP